MAAALVRPLPREAFFTLVHSQGMVVEAVEMVGSAYELSKAGHYRKIRDSGERYFDHPKMIACIVMLELKIFDWQTLVDALLHDIREDTYLLSHFRLILNFGIDVAFDIEALTHKKGEDFEQYIKRIRKRGWRAVLVKLVDRLHNMRTLSTCSLEKQRKQTAETRQRVIPLVNDLRECLPARDAWIADYLKKELEGLCAQYEEEEQLRQSQGNRE